MRTIHLMALALLTGSIGALAEEPSSVVWDRSEQYINPGSTTTVRVGQQFSIRLPANHTTGYQWRLAAPLDKAVVGLETNVYETELQADRMRIGAGGHEVWTFRAVASGQTRILLKYVRPWEQDSAGTRTNFFAVKVE